MGSIATLFFVVNARTHAERALENVRWWEVLFSLWHRRRALVWAKRASKTKITAPDQVAIITKILMHTPWWLGGNPDFAVNVLKDVLGKDLETSKLPPGDGVLFLLLLCECRMLQGEVFLANVYKNRAKEILQSIGPRRAEEVLATVRRLNVPCLFEDDRAD